MSHSLVFQSHATVPGRGSLPLWLKAHNTHADSTVHEARPNGNEVTLARDVAVKSPGLRTYGVYFLRPKASAANPDSIPPPLWLLHLEAHSSQAGKATLEWNDADIAHLYDSPIAWDTTTRPPVSKYAYVTLRREENQTKGTHDPTALSSTTLPYHVATEIDLQWVAHHHDLQHLLIMAVASTVKRRGVSASRPISMCHAGLLPHVLVEGVGNPGQLESLGLSPSELAAARNVTINVAGSGQVPLFPSDRFFFPGTVMGAAVPYGANGIHSTAASFHVTLQSPDIPLQNALADLAFHVAAPSHVRLRFRAAENTNGLHMNDLNNVMLSTSPSVTVFHSMASQVTADANEAVTLDVPFQTDVFPIYVLKLEGENVVVKGMVLLTWEYEGAVMTADSMEFLQQDALSLGRYGLKVLTVATAYQPFTIRDTRFSVHFDVDSNNHVVQLQGTCDVTYEMNGRQWLFSSFRASALSAVAAQRSQLNAPRLLLGATRPSTGQQTLPGLLEGLRVRFEPLPHSCLWLLRWTLEDNAAVKSLLQQHFQNPGRHQWLPAVKPLPDLLRQRRHEALTLVQRSVTPVTSMSITKFLETQGSDTTLDTRGDVDATSLLSNYRVIPRAQATTIENSQGILPSNDAVRSKSKPRPSVVNAKKSKLPWWFWLVSGVFGACVVGVALWLVIKANRTTAPPSMVPSSRGRRGRLQRQPSSRRPPLRQGSIRPPDQGVLPHEKKLRQRITKKEPMLV